MPNTKDKPAFAVFAYALLALFTAMLAGLYITGQSNRILTVDNVGGEYFNVTTPMSLYQRHMGRNFTATVRDSLSTKVTQEIGFYTPSDREIHIRWSTRFNGQVLVSFFENSQYTGGSPVPAINTNRRSVNAPHLIVSYSPALSSEGTVLVSSYSEDETSLKSSSLDQALILKADTKYLYRVTGIDKKASVSTVLNWMEVPLT